MARHSGRRGGNPIEFALTLPIFIAILFALFDYGWLFMNKAVADVAVARGCRTGAIVDPLDADPATVAMVEMTGWSEFIVQDCELHEWCLISDIGEVPVRRLECEMSAPFQPLVGLFPTPDAVHAYNVTRLESQRPR
jgi:hypothetical protein